jgi:hypothetical protein
LIERTNPDWQDIRDLIDGCKKQDPSSRPGRRSLMRPLTGRLPPGGSSRP